MALSRTARASLAGGEAARMPVGCVFPARIYWLRRVLMVAVLSRGFTEG